MAYRFGQPQGSISAYRPTLVDRIEDTVTSGLQRFGWSPFGARQMARKATGFLQDVTPVGGVQSAQDAQRSFKAGKWGQGTAKSVLAAAGLLPGVEGVIAKTGAKAVKKALRVYHGAAGDLAGPLRGPLWVAEDPAIAAGYAKARAKQGQSGIVHAFDAHPQMMAEQEDVEDAARRLGIHNDYTSPYEYISPNIHPRANDIINHLRSQGFDAARVNDFRIDRDFEEFPSIAVFDTSRLIRR